MKGPWRRTSPTVRSDRSKNGSVSKPSGNKAVKVALVLTKYRHQRLARKGTSGHNAHRLVFLLNLLASALFHVGVVVHRYHDVMR